MSREEKAEAAALVAAAARAEVKKRDQKIADTARRTFEKQQAIKEKLAECQQQVIEKLTEVGNAFHEVAELGRPLNTRAEWERTWALEKARGRNREDELEFEEDLPEVDTLAAILSNQLEKMLQLAAEKEAEVLNLESLSLATLAIADELIKNAQDSVNEMMNELHSAEGSREEMITRMESLSVGLGRQTSSMATIAAPQAGGKGSDGAPGGSLASASGMMRRKYAGTTGPTPVPHLRWDWGSPLPHLRRDWAHPMPTSAPGPCMRGTITRMSACVWAPGGQCMHARTHARRTHGPNPAQPAVCEYAPRAQTHARTHALRARTHYAHALCARTHACTHALHVRTHARTHGRERSPSHVRICDRCRRAGLRC
jgi:hypothetical protein